MKKFITHLTILNLMVWVILAALEVPHIISHQTKEVDVHSWVRNWCRSSKENRMDCIFFGEG